MEYRYTTSHRNNGIYWKARGSDIINDGGGNMDDDMKVQCHVRLWYWVKVLV